MIRGRDRERNTWIGDRSGGAMQGVERVEEGVVVLNNCEGRPVRVFMVMKNQKEVEGTVHHGAVKCGRKDTRLHTLIWIAIKGVNGQLMIN